MAAAGAKAARAGRGERAVDPGIAQRKRGCTPGVAAARKHPIGAEVFA